MPIAQTELIKVRTLSKKLATQIVSVEPRTSEGSLWQRLATARDANLVAPVGWFFKKDISQDALRNERGQQVYFASAFLHVVEWEGQLFILPAPDRWTAEKTDAGPQLFV